MQKKHKILILVLLTVFVFIGSVCGVFLVKPAMELKKLKELKLKDSSTAEYLGKMPETDEIYSWIKDLTDMGARKPGTEAGKKAQEYMVEKFTSFGLDNIDVVKSDATLWTCDEWGLTVSGAEIPSYYMTHTLNDGAFGKFSTPDGGLKTEIVYVGEGSESDFKNVDVQGKIVVSDVVFSDIPVGLAKFVSYLYYDPENTLPLTSSRANPYSPNTYPYNYYRAMENGAAGFVGILSNYIDSNEFNNEDYSYLGGKMKIPALWVSRTEGANIIEVIKTAGDAAEASLKMSVQIEEVKAGAVVGYLPGKSEDIIMIQSHYDSSTTGAVEDASGSSVVLALAKFYAQIPKEERDRSLLFVAMDTHFADYVSHDAFIEKYLTKGHKILADVCIEHIANEVKEVDGEVVFTGEIEPRIIFASEIDALLDITKEEIVRHGLQRTIILPTDMLGDELPTDADPYFQIGVPIISLVSAPIYLYDNIDTIDKVSKEELRPTTEAFADIVWRLTQLPKEDFSKN
ncbi:M28 family peptidase [Paenibacillus oralis]|uniref:M28 family peptidase n=1 Tax=Paenibacillus oralis TaxID=2490856 RepID=A0A3P3U825_9BACL|nr:M28 family peptidase [Paenibacillus oralis]RRJ64633.1 M28 family peptidase [Paenibacillus oralis]